MTTTAAEISRAMTKSTFGRFLDPLIERGVRGTTEKLTAPMIQKALNKLTSGKYPEFSEFVRGLAGTATTGVIGIPHLELPKEAFGGDTEAWQLANMFLNDTIKNEAGKAIGGLVASGGMLQGVLPDGEINDLIVAVVTEYDPDVYFPVSIHPETRVVTVLSKAVQGWFSRRQRELINFEISQRGKQKRGRYDAEPMDARQAYKPELLLMGVADAERAGYKADPKTLALPGTEVKEAKPLVDKISFKAHTVLMAILSELAVRKNGGRADSAIILSALESLAASDGHVKYLEKILEGMTLRNKTTLKDGETRKYVGVVEAQQIPLIINQCLSAGGKAGLREDARDALDQAIDTGKVIETTRSLAEDFYVKAAKFIKGDLKRYLKALAAIAAVGAVIWLIGCIACIWWMIVIGGLLVIGSVLPVALAAQGLSDYLTKAIDVGTGWAQLLYEQLEQLTGSPQAVVEKTSRIRYFGYEISKIVGFISFFIFMVLLYKSWLGYDQLCQLSHIAVGLLFVAALTSTAAANSYEDRDAKGFFGSLFKFKQDTGTATLFSLFVKLAIVTSLLLVPIYSMVPSTPASNMGYSIVSDDKQGYISAPDGKLFKIEDSALVEFKESGVLKECEDSRGETTLCVRPGMVIPDLYGDGYSYLVRWDGSITMEIDPDENTVLASVASSTGSQPRGTVDFIETLFGVPLWLFILILIVTILMVPIGGSALVASAGGVVAMLLGKESGFTTTLLGSGASIAAGMVLVFLLAFMLIWPGVTMVSDATANEGFFAPEIALVESSRSSTATTSTSSVSVPIEDMTTEELDEEFEQATVRVNEAIAKLQNL